MAVLMPVFDKYPIEGEIIGRLLVGYGELEYGLYECVGVALGNKANAFQKLFGIRGEEKRIKTADEQVRTRYEVIGLTTEFNETLAAMDWCRLVRNQYAHCHWGDFGRGLHFTNLEDAVKSKSGPSNFTPLLIDLSLLEEQASYFRYTEHCLVYLRAEYETRSGSLRCHPFDPPIHIGAPPKHR